MTPDIPRIGDDPHLWFSHALTLARAQRTAEARRVLLHVLSLNPDHTGARRELALMVSDSEYLSRSVRTFLHLSSVVLAVVAVAGFRFAQNDHPSAARWTVLVAVLVPVALIGWFLGRLSPIQRPRLWPVITTQGRAVALAAVSAILVLVAAAGPDTWLSWLLGSAAVAGVLARVLTVGEKRDRREGVEIPYVLGTVTLGVITAACLVLSVIFLMAGASFGQPALTVAAVMLTLAGFVTGRMIVKRGENPGFRSEPPGMCR